MSEPPLKHTARQYWLVAGLCELALKRGHEDYYLEAEDSFLALEPSAATAEAARMFKDLFTRPQSEVTMQKIIAEMWRLHERALKEEAATVAATMLREYEGMLE